MKMTWIEGKDEWSPYCINHMDAIRAKYFPKAAPKVDKDGNEVARVLPNRKAINNLSEAAATNAPAPEGPIQVSPWALNQQQHLCCSAAPHRWQLCACDKASARDAASPVGPHPLAGLLKSRLAEAVTSVSRQVWWKRFQVSHIETYLCGHPNERHLLASRLCSCRTALW